MKLKRLLKKILPQSLVNAYEASKIAEPIIIRVCPICRFKGEFKNYGSPPRYGARCPNCLSLERHRLFWNWFSDNRGEIIEPVVHFAAEKVLANELRKSYSDYRTADLFNTADLVLNLEGIDLPSESQGTIICNHVLEHVNDKKALVEINRVLKQAGILITSVPIIEGWEKTYENESIVDPISRRAHFGQEDHVRYYGRDFREKLRAAGFEVVREITAEGIDVVTYGLIRGEKIFLCKKVRSAFAE